MKKRGIGYGTAWQGVNIHFGHPDTSTVKLELTDDLQLRLGVAAADLGQGIPETNRVILSEQMGNFPLDHIEMIDPDTAVTPDGGATGASRQTALTGNAVAYASQILKQRLVSVAAEMLDNPPDKTRLNGLKFYGTGRKSIGLARVVKECARVGLSLDVIVRFTGPPTTGLDEKGQGYPINQFSYATYVAEVEVDTDTGEVTVLSVDAFVDAGRIIRRIGAEMQVEGGLAMALGHTLTEEFKQKEGWPETDSLTTYLIPTIYDVPLDISSDFLDEQPIPFGALGAKGLAELVLTPVAPAVINAIYDAIGVTVSELPATPERVLMALQQADKQQ